MDAVDREAHEMFMKDAVDALQEALHIDRAEKVIEKLMKAGVLNGTMRLDEVLEAFNKRKAELIGNTEEEDGPEENEE